MFVTANNGDQSALFKYFPDNFFAQAIATTYNHYVLKFESDGVDRGVDFSHDILNHRDQYKNYGQHYQDYIHLSFQR